MMPYRGTVSFMILNNILLFAHSHGVFFNANSIKGKSEGNGGGGGSLKLNSLAHLAEERCLLVSESASYP